MRATEEFLQHRFFAFDGDGCRCLLVPEAAVLSCKTAWAHFEQLRRVGEHPRDLVHTSILVRHGCFDGAVVDGLRVHSLQMEEAKLLHMRKSGKFSEKELTL